MFTIIVGPIIVILLFLVFGSYRISIHASTGDDDARLLVRVSSRWECFGVEWRREEEAGRFMLSILGRRFSLRRKASPEKAGSVGVEGDEAKKLEKPRRRLSALCFLKRMLPRFPGLIKRLLAVFRVEDFRLRGDMGLGEPALTGQAYGWIQGAAVACGATAVSIRPRFDGPILEGDLTLVLGFVLINVIWVGMRTAVSAGWTFLRCRR